MSYIRLRVNPRAMWHGCCFARVCARPGASRRVCARMCAYVRYIVSVLMECIQTLRDWAIHSQGKIVSMLTNSRLGGTNLPKNCLPIQRQRNHAKPLIYKAFQPSTMLGANLARSRRTYPCCPSLAWPGWAWATGGRRVSCIQRRPQK